MPRPLATLAALFLTGAAFTALFAQRWRSVCASAAERARSLPGDELIRNPVASLTHAITIEAPATMVWPWLVQMGVGRGGWYSYDVLDNGCRASAEAIVPELQHVKVGDVFPASAGATDAFTVLHLDAPRALVLGYQAPDGPEPAATWSFTLDDLRGRTRLIVRARGSDLYHAFRLPPSVEALIIRIIHAFMQQKQLRTIAQRAEGLAAQTPPVARPPRPAFTAAG